MTRESRFVRLGLLDVDERLGQVTAGAASRDDVAMAIVVSSRAFGLLLSLAHKAEAVVRDSVVLRVLQARRREWSQASASRRQWTAGLVLIVAAAVHLVLNGMVGDTPGWLWLIIPITAVAVGAALVTGARHTAVGTRS